ncbi:MAG: DNA repair protein MmcB-related protein [Rhodobacteraceae bacterium]|nr:DNA repair protein MmcB-related protein [Paracoccaceae bacterium]
MDDQSLSLLQPGQRLQRGVSRALLGLGFATIEEFVPDAGLRVDVIGLSPKGEIWIIECKSSLADFRGDGKWQGYLPWCDRFFWAVNTDFPREVLPEETGLILADGYGAEVMREAPHTPVAAARRKALTLKFARHAALRLQGMRDPGGISL